jgi:acetylornithine deacetylase/succinyl-diaminopimelate desuccinylase-like protein
MSKLRVHGWVRVCSSGLATLLLTAAAAAAQPIIPPAAGTPPAGFDRAVAQQQTLALLSQLIAIDTQNPPGNELRVARHFESVLQGVPGVEIHVLESAPGRGNIVARLRAATPTKQPILVMGHMDTVGVDPTKWTSPAFTATERDGYLYGRGAIDDKGSLAAMVVAMRMLAPLRATLDRDIILLGTAAEESGGPEGISHVLEKHFDLIKDAEFALNEGGRVRVRSGRIVSINVQVTEKLSYTVTATARGTSGHGSVPLPDNAIAALSRALARVHELKLPVQLNPTNREYFKRLATIEQNPEMRDAMAAIATATDRATIDRAAAVLSRDVTYNATLRTGVSLTMISGGIRGNVIPSDATATLNVRVPPGGDIAADVRELNRVGAESQVRFEVRGNPRAGPPASPITSLVFQAMETAAKAMAPDSIVIPFMSTGATDGAQLRARGIPTYGILLLPLYEDDELRMHGDDERTPIASLGWATEYIYRTLQEVGRK